MYDPQDLITLIKSRTPIIIVETTDEPRILDLIHYASDTLKLKLLKWSVIGGLMDITAQREADESTLEPADMLKVIWNLKNPGIYVLIDFHPFLTDARNIRLMKEIALTASKYRQTIILLSNKIDLPSELIVYTGKFELALPDEKTIRSIVDNILRKRLPAGKNQFAAVSPELEKLIVKNFIGLSIPEIERIAQRFINMPVITREIIAEIAKSKYMILNKDSVLSFECETAHFTDIGGLKKLKQWLRKRRSVFLKEKKIPGSDVPKGILLLGVQGGGKSLAAKAVAGAWGIPLLRLDFGALYDKYIGETERRTREAFKMSDRMAPCVLWMDEIEKGIATENSDSGVSHRVLSTLLTWMAERKSCVFLVATANDIQSLPAELMRKGRFDEIFFVDLPNSAVRKEILAIHLGKRGLNVKVFDLDKLANACEGFSGSEIEQAVVSGLYAMSSESGVLNDDILLQEMKVTRPLSVVMAENVAALREWAKDRTVSAN